MIKKGLASDMGFRSGQGEGVGSDGDQRRGRLMLVQRGSGLEGQGEQGYGLEITGRLGGTREKKSEIPQSEKSTQSQRGMFQVGVPEYFRTLFGVDVLSDVHGVTVLVLINAPSARSVFYEIEGKL